jgi:hypothetical protein
MAREGTLGKADQPINGARLCRQNPMSPLSAVLHEQALKASRRLVRDEDRLIPSALGAQPKEFTPQSNTWVGGVVLALKEQHHFACRRVDPVSAAGPRHCPAYYDHIGFMVESRLSRNKYANLRLKWRTLGKLDNGVGEGFCVAPKMPRTGPESADPGKRADAVFKSYIRPLLLRRSEYEQVSLKPVLICR